MKWNVEALVRLEERGIISAQEVRQLLRLDEVLGIAEKRKTDKKQAPEDEKES